MLKAPTNQRRDHLLEVFGAIRDGRRGAQKGVVAMTHLMVKEHEEK